ncbi:MAG: hypothetical protein KDC57_06780 [Saprospiraceae bacterium]|nr:hypothetical protein [Saprospiraceae bacterium]
MRCAFWFLLALHLSNLEAQDSLLLIREVPFEVPLADSAMAHLPDIQLIAKAGQDGLLIRWAPTNPVVWQMGIRFGYRLERQILEEGVSFEQASFVPVTMSPVKPWPLDNWQAIVNEQTPYTATAAMAIYGASNAGNGFVNQAHDQENRMGFNLLAADFDRQAAEASGLFYLEKDTSANTYGLYRIFIYDPVSGYRSDTTYQVIGYQTPLMNPGPQMLAPVEDEHTIQVRWEGSNPGYSGYWIERSTDDLHFERLNQQPFINAITDLRPDNDEIIYLDSLTENGVAYYYRVIGIDAFAEESLPSRSVKATGVDRTSPHAPDELVIREMTDHSLVLNWQLDNPSDDLAGFRVYTSKTADGDFTLLSEGLLEPGAREFRDLLPDLQNTNYYYVSAIDQNGNEAASPVQYAITADNLPPQAPVNLEYQIDSIGRLLIKWDAPADRDIRGYLIHYANEPQGPYAVVPGAYLTNTFFVDSVNLHTLTEHLYFYVIAVDWSYNASKASEILAVKKPDRIPPAPAIFTGYFAGVDTISLSWLPGASEDVQAVHLERREQGGEWRRLDRFSDQISPFLDTDISEGITYEYRLITEDDDGNRTIAEKTLTLTAQHTFFLPDIADFRVQLEKETATLTWVYPNADRFMFILYRSVKDEPLETYQLLNGITRWQDVDIKRRTDYTYAIKAKAKDGRESKLIAITTH